MSFLTSQWSLEASAGGSLRDRARDRRPAPWWSTEKVWRALVVGVTPERAPILGRALTKAERRRLDLQAARLDAALAPWQRERGRIAALLTAPVAGQRFLLPSGVSAAAAFGPKPGSAACPAEAVPLAPETEV